MRGKDFDKFHRMKNEPFSKVSKKAFRNSLYEKTWCLKRAKKFGKRSTHFRPSFQDIRVKEAGTLRDQNSTFTSREYGLTKRAVVSWLAYPFGPRAFTNFRKNLFSNFQWLIPPQLRIPVKRTKLRSKGLVPGVNFCVSARKKIKKSGYFFAAKVETIL